MANKKIGLNETEKKILKVMAKYRRPMTVLEISEKTGISRPTVYKYVNKLIKRGVISHG